MLKKISMEMDTLPNNNMPSLEVACIINTIS